jgi:predicted O-methyltransferase YrrM
MNIDLIDQTLKHIENIELGELNAEQIQPGLPRKTKFASIPPSTGEWLYNLALKSKAKRILEIGSSVGYSTLWLAKAAVQTQGQIWATEINQGRIKLGKEHFQMAGVEKLVTYVTNDASELLKNWHGDFFDFIFIDAFKKDYLKYFDLASKFLEQNGIIVFDNVISHQEDLKEFLEQIKNNPDFVSEIIDKDNGLLVIKPSILSNGSREA